MLESFNSWPKLLPDVNKMVQAGFYATGEGDEVACILCGVIIHEWEPQDDPWDEHFKANSHCELLKLNKKPVVFRFL